MVNSRDRFISSWFILLILASTGVGCAGPATPLGAVWAWTTDQTQKETDASEGLSDHEVSRDPQAVTGSSGPEIEFLPSRQALHRPLPLRVIVKDQSGFLDGYQMEVLYNGVDVTRSFLSQSRVHINEPAGRITILNPIVRLSPLEEHQIEFRYTSPNGRVLQARYRSPECNAFDSRNVLHVGEFSPPVELINAIHQYAKLDGFNPALVTALIAQESGFNPKAVSIAKAIGLTQVTEIADRELIEMTPEWPRYQKINDLSTFRLKALVMSGRLNEENEWRLNPELSIRGGILFAGILAERWSTPDNLSEIRDLFEDPEVARTRLILASYHSGYARVKRALHRLKKDWLNSNDLKAARRYVNKVFSYCSHFTEGEVLYL